MGDTRRIRLDSLTSLRFFAAFGVVLYHCALFMPDIWWPFHAVVQYGHVGVTFFFVLSGFVLTWSRREGESRQNFYWRRFARVWPSHFLTTLLAIPVVILVGEPVLWVALPAVLLMLHAWMPPGDWHYAFNGPSWSLSAEAFFYALFPFLIGIASWGTHRLKHLGIVVLALLVGGGIGTALVFPPFTWGFLLGVNPAYRIGEFLLGIVVALAVERGKFPKWSMRSAVTVLCTAYFILATTAWRMNWGELPAFVPGLVLLPAFIMLIASAAQHDIAGQDGGFLRQPWIIRLGEISFALYLVHALVIHVVIAVAEPLKLNGVAWAIVALPVSMLAIMLAWLLHRLVEAPAESAIRRRFVRADVRAKSHRSRSSVASQHADELR